MNLWVMRQVKCTNAHPSGSAHKQVSSTCDPNPHLHCHWMPTLRFEENSIWICLHAYATWIPVHPILVLFTACLFKAIWTQWHTYIHSTVANWIRLLQSELSDQLPEPIMGCCCIFNLCKSVECIQRESNIAPFENYIIRCITIYCILL
jgi:hypothetical protein